MREYDIIESVNQNRLISTYKIIPILDKITFTMSIIMITIFLWLPPILISSNNLYIKIGIFFLITILFFALSNFRWNRSMKLKIIRTSKSENDNKVLIKKIILRSGFTIIQNSYNHIQATDSLNRLELNFIFSSKEIHINTNYLFFRSVWPATKTCNNLINEIEKGIIAGT